MIPKQHKSASDIDQYIETHPLKFYNFQSKTPLTCLNKLTIILKTESVTKKYTIDQDNGRIIDLTNLSLTIPIDVPNIHSNSELISPSLRSKWINDIRDGFKVDLELIVSTATSSTVSKVFNIRIYPFSVQNFMLDLSFIPSKAPGPSKLNFKTFIFLDRTLNRDTGKTSKLEYVPSKSVPCNPEEDPSSKSNTPPTGDDKSSNSDNSIVVIDNQKKGGKISFVKRISKFLNIKRIPVLPKHKERTSESSDKNCEFNAMANDLNGYLESEERENKKYKLTNENYVIKNKLYTKFTDLVLLNHGNFELLFNLQNILLEKSRVLLTLIGSKCLHLLNTLSNFRKKLTRYRELMADVMEQIDNHKAGKRSLVHQKLEELHILRLRNQGYYKQNYNVHKKNIKVINDCDFLKHGSEDGIKKLDVLKKIATNLLNLKDNFNEFITSSDILRNKQVKILGSLKGEYMEHFEKVMENEAIINRYRKQEKKMKRMKKEITRSSKTNNNFCIFNSQLKGIKSQNRKGEISDIIWRLKKYYSNKLFINRFLDFYMEQLMEKLEKNSPSK
eukprot:GAHX01000493.1.p1 GENE.GAHX01000493.1~~GAHX01000493.1.p1  ORF type:complete len:559 (+),score=126.85 GAHX01000493.1:100-1776(+)